MTGRARSSSAAEPFEIQIPSGTGVRFFPAEDWTGDGPPDSTVLEFSSPEAAIAFRDKVNAEINVGGKASEATKQRGRDLAKEHGW